MSGAKKFVFCEGKDDVLVIRALARALELDIAIEEYGGKDKLTIVLQGLSTRPEFAQQQVASLAILRDADASAAAAFVSVRDSLRQNHFEAPRSRWDFHRINAPDWSVHCWGAGSGHD